MRQISTDRQNNNWENTWEVPKRQAIDDVGSSSGLARFSYFSCWSVWVTSVAFGDETDTKAAPETGRNGVESSNSFDLLGVAVLLDGPVGGEENYAGEVDGRGHEDRRDDQLFLKLTLNILKHTFLKMPYWFFLFLFFLLGLRSNVNLVFSVNILNKFLNKLHFILMRPREIHFYHFSVNLTCSISQCRKIQMCFGVITMLIAEQGHLIELLLV